MIGQRLGGRYEVLAQIGGGGMALVYKAHDILLNRKVAIKVLRSQYVHDEDFIRRFRREAQSAASLSHPNVVSIYDVGQEKEIHYIVMEYIEGINLNEKIKEQAPMQVDAAVRIASQICHALEHAHHNQIIHRDIKPHNILIGKNGSVKVTDFGIARAATSSDITQTGSVIGSVHYFSPEHAKGVAQGAKSDLYSLGIVLYQMLTGKLPFIGESPISVALKHLQEDVEDPRKVNPLIPQSVENIILKAVRKNPQERYQSAHEMLDDLDSCLSPARMYEEKINFYGLHGYDDNEQTRVVPAIRPDQLHSNSSHANEALSRRQPIPETEKEWVGLDEEPRKSRPWIKPLVWFIVVIGILALMWYGVVYLKSIFQVPEVDVPSVIHLQIEEAETKLQEAELLAERIYQFSDTVEAEVVIDQEKANMRVKVGSTIKLTVSQGKEMSVMLDWIGKDWQDAKLELEAALNSDQYSAEHIQSDEPMGTIIKQSPQPDESYNPKDVVMLFTVSGGKGTFPMPNLIGETEQSARSIILKHNLKLADDKVMYEASYTTPEGIVFKQWLYEPDDPVEPGSEVTIYVSTGYPDDAVEVTEPVVLNPSEPGKKTTYRIMISDASGEHRQWGVKEITKTSTLYVTVLLSAEKKNAVISIYENEVFLNTITVTEHKEDDQEIVPEEPVEQIEPIEDSSGNEWPDGQENELPVDDQQLQD